MGIFLITIGVMMMVGYFITVWNGDNKKSQEIVYTFTIIIALGFLSPIAYISSKANDDCHVVLHAISVDNLKPEMEYKILGNDTIETTYHYNVDDIHIKIEK